MIFAPKSQRMSRHYIYTLANENVRIEVWAINEIDLVLLLFFSPEYFSAEIYKSV